MIKHIAIALGAATLSFIPTLAHAQEGATGEPSVDVEVYPPEVGVLPPTRVPTPPSVVDPDGGTLPVSGSDSTVMMLQIGSLLLVAGGAAVVATHRRRGAAAPA